MKFEPGFFAVFNTILPGAGPCAAVRTSLSPSLLGHLFSENVPQKSLHVIITPFKETMDHLSYCCLCMMDHPFKERIDRLPPDNSRVLPQASTSVKPTFFRSSQSTPERTRACQSTPKHTGACQRYGSKPKPQSIQSCQSIWSCQKHSELLNHETSSIIIIIPYYCWY